MWDLGQGWEGPTEGLRGAANMLPLGLWDKHHSPGGLGLGKGKQKAPNSAVMGVLGFVAVFFSSYAPPHLPVPKFSKHKEHGQFVQIEPLVSLQEFGRVSGGEKENALRLWWESDRKECVYERKGE